MKTLLAFFNAIWNYPPPLCEYCGANDWVVIGHDGGLQLSCMPIHACRACSVT